MASVNGSELAGEASVSTNDIPIGHIPGYPTYFWFLPSRNIFATVKFKNRLNGRTGLNSLFLGFLKRFTSYTQTEINQETDQIIVTGYKRNNKTEYTNYKPCFKSYPIRQPGKIEYLKKHYSTITKIHQKATLESTNIDDRKLFEKLLNNLGLIQTEPLSKDVRFSSDINFSPTADELDNIITNWQQSSSSLEDVGFKLKGEPSIIWLSNSLVKAEESMQISRDENNIVSLQSLEREILNKKEKLLGLLSKNND